MASMQGEVSCSFHIEMHATVWWRTQALLLPQSMLEDVKAAHKSKRSGLSEALWPAIGHRLLHGYASSTRRPGCRRQCIAIVRSIKVHLPNCSLGHL